MRKLTVSVKPNFFMKGVMKSLFDNIVSFELKELMRIDFSKGKKIGVGDIVVKEGVDLDKLKSIKKFKILDVLEKKGNIYTCLVKVDVPKSGTKILKFFDFDLIYDIPTIITKELLTYSVIGEEKNLMKFLKVIKLVGSTEKVIYKQADYRGIGITQSLTGKQNNILKEAVKLGYYNYPREIETKELADRLSISKTTLVEHLRKAENRVMGKIFVK